MPLSIAAPQRCAAVGASLLTALVFRLTLLLPRRTRRFGALAAAVLFVAVFPANINMVRLWWDKPWPMRIASLARLPLQIPMITTALKVRRHS